MAVYREQLAGPVPSFPAPLEARITAYLQGHCQVNASSGVYLSRPRCPAGARRIRLRVAAVHVTRAPGITQEPMMSGREGQMPSQGEEIADGIVNRRGTAGPAPPI